MTLGIFLNVLTTNALKSCHQNTKQKSFGALVLYWIQFVLKSADANFEMSKVRLEHLTFNFSMSNQLYDSNFEMSKNSTRTFDNSNDRFEC